MERSRLSIRALVVLASELGAEHLFGVRDPFMMMDHEEIRAAYEVCLEELEQSGAITRQFEGAAIVRGELRPPPASSGRRRWPPPPPLPSHRVRLSVCPAPVAAA